MIQTQRRRLYTVLILLLLVLFACTPALASSALESRISRLEAENAQLRAQINRLESQVFGLSRPQSRVEIDRRIPTPQPSTRGQRQVTSADPMFDRLATLVIELKERVNKLEAQVAAFKKKGTS